MNNFFEVIEEMNSKWINDKNFKIKLIKTEENELFKLKATTKYNINKNISNETYFGKSETTCNSEFECNENIQKCINDFYKNECEFVKEDIINQAKNLKVKEKNPNFYKNWQILEIAESYIEDCTSCNTNGTVDCPSCDNVFGNPTGKVDCSGCSGRGDNLCFSCNSTGRIGDSYCSSCGGTGRKTCDYCYGSRKQTCQYCNGHLVVNCNSCDGYQYFTKIKKLSFNISSTTSFSWNKPNTPDWLNNYLDAELVNREKTNLFNILEHNPQNFNLENFKKEYFTSSTECELKTFNVILEDQNKKEYNCKFIHSDSIPFHLDYIFDDYISQLCDDFKEKENIEFKKMFFDNNIVNDIISDKNNHDFMKQKMITGNTRLKVENTFKDFYKVYLKQKNNINIKDIFQWTGIFFLCIFLSFFALDLFTDKNINWNTISFNNILSNTSLAMSSFNIKDFNIGHIFSVLIISFISQKFLGGLNRSFLRYLGWVLTSFFILFLFYFNLKPEFIDVVWKLDFSNISEKFLSLSKLSIDIFLYSSLIAILRARNKICSNIKETMKILNNDILNSKLGS